MAKSLDIKNLSLSAESMKPRTASAEVLGTAELVVLILESLDELSLVRAQGVNGLFHGLIQTTTKLRLRIGLTVLQSSNSDAQKTTTETTTKKTHRWNPLLEWLVTRSFLLENATNGPISRTPNSVICHALPHAHHAARSPASSIHKILLTDPLVRRAVVLFYPSKPSISDLLYGQRLPCDVEVSNENGVTIGDVLGIWAGESNHQKHLPIGICVPTSTEGKIQIPGLVAPKLKSSVTSVMFLLDMLPPYTNTTYDRPNRVCGKLAYEFYRVFCAEGWFDCSMEDQVKAMAELMCVRKRYSEMKLAPSDLKWPAWPALAWETKAGRYISTVTYEDMKTGRKEKRDYGYRVEYAAGLVFNRG